MPVQTPTHKIVENFFAAQFEVFDLFNVILAKCENDLSLAKDQSSYDLARSIFKDLLRFETEFGEFDADLWNYVYNIGGYRDVVSQLVIEEGLADHKEYFFRRIERCVSMIEDVVTEIKAFGYEWGDVDQLLDAVEKLFDSSEAIIEVEPNELDDPEIISLVEKIPPQKLAPIEVMVSAVMIKRKPPSLTAIAANKLSLAQAHRALIDAVGDMNDDIISSNCDVRVKRISYRILKEISKEFRDFSPIAFGINLEMLASFSNVITEEFGDAAAAYLLSCIAQCDTFVRNFKLWNEYVENARASDLPSGDSVARILIDITQHDLFAEDVKEAASDLSEEVKDSKIDTNKLRYAVFQSASNVISVAIKESLKYIANLARKGISYVFSTVERAVGTIALSWLLYNYPRLIELSDKYELFRWIKPVVEFIKRYTSS